MSSRRRRLPAISGQPEPPIPGLIIHCSDGKTLSVAAQPFLTFFPIIPGPKWRANIAFDHPSETSQTLHNAICLTTHSSRLPFLRPSTSAAPEVTLLVLLSPITRFVHLHGSNDPRQCLLKCVRRVVAWNGCSPLVPFVGGAVLDDMTTCSWALGVARWVWEGVDEKRVSLAVSEGGQEPKHEEEAVVVYDCAGSGSPPPSRARRTTSTPTQDPTQHGIPDCVTLELSALPYVVDRMLPKPYRWAMARASSEVDLTSKGKGKQLVTRFEELLGVAKAYEAQLEAVLS